MEKIFSDQSLINYLKLLENILFDSITNEKSEKSEKYTKYNDKLRNFALQCVKNLIPSMNLIQNVIIVHIFLLFLRSSSNYYWR